MVNEAREGIDGGAQVLLTRSDLSGVGVVARAEPGVRLRTTDWSSASGVARDLGIRATAPRKQWLLAQ